MQISNVYVQSNIADVARRASDPASLSKKEEAAKREEPTKKPTAKNEAVNVSISTSGKGASAEALVISRANALPEMRDEKIGLAKERIGNGYYNTPEFSKELSNRLVEG